MSRPKKLATYLREFNDLAKVITGRDLMELGSLFVSMTRNHESYDVNDPYNILGIQHGASDRLVKFAFRAAAFEYHPDTGAHPDPAKFQQAKEAYDAIMKERAPNEPVG